MITFCACIAVNIWSKKWQMFSHFTGENIYKIIALTPGANLTTPEIQRKRCSSLDRF
jgi:hypothetical protein